LRCPWSATFSPDGNGGIALPKIVDSNADHMPAGSAQNGHGRHFSLPFHVRRPPLWLLAVQRFGGGGGGGGAYR